MTATEVPKEEALRLGEPDAQASAADQELMSVLYQEHAGPLLRYVLRFVHGDRQRAEDVVQETLIRAWKHSEGLVPVGGSLRPWLMAVARRIVIDSYRRMAVRPEEVEPSALEFMHGRDEADLVLLRMTLTAALADLSPVHRQILFETYYRDCTVMQAATSLEIPLGTVKSRVFYALRSLRAALERRGVTV